MSWFSRLIGRLRPRNSAIVPGTESFQVLWDWILSPTTVDKDLRRNLVRQRGEARSLALVNPLARQYLGLLENNVIGPQGIKLQAQVRTAKGELDKEANDAIEAWWSDFWRDPWVDGRLTGLAGEQLLIRSLAVDGEVFVRLVKGFPNKHGFALQMIDADLVDHTLNAPRGRAQGTANEIRLGVEVDSWGRPVAYWVREEAEGRKHLRVPAADMLHLWVPERIGQTRGLTWFNSIIVPAKMLDGYLEAAVTAARTAACQMMVFKQTAPALGGAPKAVPTNYTIEARPGGGVTLPPGLEMQPFDPKHPTAEGPGFVKSCERYIATGLRVSYNALANDLEGVNYSSIRSGLLIERDGWRLLQKMWIDRFRQPVAEAAIAAALLVGALRLPSRDPARYALFRWIPRGWDWVDPLKDISAAEKGLQLRLTSRKKIAGEKGDDLEEIFEDLADEKRLAAQHGIDMDPPASAGLPEEDEGMTPEERATDRKRALALVAAYRGDA